MKVKLDKYRFDNDEIKNFDKSKIIYIPLISGKDKDITILVKKDEYVYKGTIVGKRKGDYRIPICSSVSGTVLGFEEKTCYNGKKIKCVVIENDFKEKIVNKITVKRSINKYSKSEFIERLRENGIVGLGGEGFPTYLKYSLNKIETLIVNAVECEPYNLADEVIVKNKCEEILETIDAILEINNIPNAIIAIKKNSPLKNILDNFVGTYLKIQVRLVKDIYPLGYEKILIKTLLNKEYKNNPDEIGVVVNNVSTIYAIYEALKYNKPLIERTITFSGENLINKCNLTVKIGTPVKDILNNLKIKENSIVVCGGAMMGKQVEDLVISANIKSILVLPKPNYISTECINCGKCLEVCPIKLVPVMIMKCNEIKKLKSLHPEKCIECGLCSYICPSKINVREFVINKKKELGCDK